MYGEPKYVILMLVEILVAYFGALLIDKYKSKEIFLITIIIHIGLLCVFKYTDLFIGTINSIFKTNISFFNIANNNNVFRTFLSNSKCYNFKIS